MLYRGITTIRIQLVCNCSLQFAVAFDQILSNKKNSFFADETTKNEFFIDQDLE